MAIAQIQSTAREDEVRRSIEQAMSAQGGRATRNEPGTLAMELGGTVGKAYLAGGFRDKMKMPMELVVTTNAGTGGTGLTLDVHSRGTASGVMSGGWLGVIKQNKAEKIWLQQAMDAVPGKVGGAGNDAAGAG